MEDRGWGLAATSELLELKILAIVDEASFLRRNRAISRGKRKGFLPHTHTRARGENLVCARHREQISNVSARFTVKYRILSPAIRL